MAELAGRPPGTEALTLSLGGGRVPALLLRPSAHGPVPAALLVHAYSSSKEQLAGSIGGPLARRGIASLAIDLPLHGGRDERVLAGGRPDPLALLRQWRLALAEARDAVRWLAGRDWVAPGRIGALGYSLGSYVALLTAAREPLVTAVIVAAGGDLPDTPWTSVARMLGDPLAAVRRLAGRPLLLVHGRHDRTIAPGYAQRLFDAASEPKELAWFDAGHILPPAAGDHAAAWLKAALGQPRRREGRTGS